MSGISGDLLLTVGAAAAGFGSSWITNRRSNRTAAAKSVIDRGKLELENRREDGEAYERANQINQQIVESLRSELTALQATIASLREDLAAARADNSELRARIRELESSARTMQGLLDQAGVDHPARQQQF